MSKIQAVIFDLYGTLIDIHTDERRREVWEYLSSYMQYFGMRIGREKLEQDFDSEREEYLRSRDERYPELDLEAVFAAILRKEGINDRFLVESFCKLFRLLTRDKFQLFPDALPVLREIKGSRYPLAVVSNAQRAFTRDEMRMLYLDQFFQHTVLSTDFGFAKPDPRLFSVAASLLEVPPESAVYIGDNPENDISGPQQIGMKVILLERDRKPVSSEVKPDFVTGDLYKAWEWIKQT